MALIVMKFGGSSVADVPCVQRVANHIIRARQSGNDVVVVVSAMGKTTDELISLARGVNSKPVGREMDMLISAGEQISSAILTMALQARQVEAVSLTGGQAGIYTDDDHTKAKIRRIDPDPIRKMLEKSHIVIVAGFQGLTSEQNIATLGRGGSDLTAVALAAVLKADRCQIYTDVEGVYTADPGRVEKAIKLDEIIYDEMLELASLGAKVLQSRSVELAKKYSVEMEVLSSFTGNPGTVVKAEVTNMEEVVVRGVAADRDQAKITIRSVLDRPGIAARIFQDLAAASVNVDIIVQNISDKGHTDISFTVPLDDLSTARSVVSELTDEVEGAGIVVDENVAKVSMVGIGMRSHSGVAYRMFEALAESGINIEMISTSEIKVSVVIAREQADCALQVLHDAFDLSATGA